MTQLVQYTFEPIIIPQEEIDYYQELHNNVLNNFIRNFQEHIEVIDNQLRFLNHQFFTITRSNLVESLDWEEVHKIQQSYIDKKIELLQQKDLKQRKIQIVEEILIQRRRNPRNQHVQIYNQN